VDQHSVEDSGRHCVLAHDLNNKLAAIVGYCDLMTDDVKEDGVSAKRLVEIRELALSMAKKINGYDCVMIGVNARPVFAVQPPLASLR
jgi:hypothetical protein